MVVLARATDSLLLNLVVATIFGAIVSAIAASRGRNAIGWFFVGFFSFCIGLILVLVLPDLKQERARLDHDRMEKRRLREQLAQERLKNQAFRGHVAERLDVHDRLLGTDTRNVQAPMLPPVAPEAPPAEEGGLPRDGWYVAPPGGDPEGPMPLSELRERISRGETTASTLVWHGTLSNWMPVSRTALSRFLLT
jgi:hypothetical protein